MTVITSAHVATNINWVPIKKELTELNKLLEVNDLFVQVSTEILEHRLTEDDLHFTDETLNSLLKAESNLNVRRALQFIWRRYGHGGKISLQDQLSLALIFPSALKYIKNPSIKVH